MNVLYVTNMYPSEATPFEGVFIKEQVEYCHKVYGINYKLFVIDRSRHKYLNYLSSIFKIKNVISKGNFDLIHIHFGLAGIFLLLNPLIKVPVIVTFHGSDIISFKKKEGLMQKISHMVAARADKIIILNDKMASKLGKYQNKSVKIPCGINTEIFKVARNNLKNKKLVIGFPSDRNREVKNYPLFKAVVNILLEKGFQIETLEFANFSRVEMAQNLSRLDCLLMTSFSEGSPQIVKEAMVCGVPIVTTRVGDVANLLNGVKNCAVVDSFDACLLAEKVCEILKLAPKDRFTNGSEKITQLALNQEKVCSNIYDVYQSLLVQ